MRQHFSFSFQINELTQKQPWVNTGGMESTPGSRFLPIAALFAVQLIFGFNYAASKEILLHFAPTLWGAIRLMLSASLMFATAHWIVPRDLRRVDRDFLKKTCFFGVVGISLSQLFFLVGLQHTTTANSAIMNSVTPLLTLLVGVLAGAERFTPIRGLSFCLALAGIFSIRDLSEFRLSSETFVGDLATLANCLMLAIFFTWSRDFLRKNSTYWATAWMFLFGSIVLALVSLADFHLPELATLDRRFYTSASYNILFATLITYFLNSWTLTKVSPSLVALFFYFQPVIAVLTGWWLLGETPTPRTFLAMGLIFSGLGIGVVKRS
jgi:drug/metabolite transporter (DMT)-like permease